MGVNDHLDIDQAGLDFIAKYEGNVLHPYQDCCGLWTIGVGHLIVGHDSFSSVGNADVRAMLTTSGHMQKPNPYLGHAISKEESFQILHVDAQKCVQAIRHYVPNTPLNQNMFNALVCFLFNVGTGWIMKGGVKNALDAGDYQGVCTALLNFSKAKVNGVVQTIPGLLHRRQAEVALFCAEVPPANELDGLDEATKDAHLYAVGHASERVSCQYAGDCADHPEGTAC
jgi:lysozyme